MQELGQFMSLVSDEKQKVQKIQEEKDKRFKLVFMPNDFERFLSGFDFGIVTYGTIAYELFSLRVPKVS